MHYSIELIYYVIQLLLEMLCYLSENLLCVCLIDTT